MHSVCNLVHTYSSPVNLTNALLQNIVSSGFIGGGGGGGGWPPAIITQPCKKVVFRICICALVTRCH